MCDFDHTCGDDSTGKRDDLFIACRDPAPDASGVRPDLARILLCDATSVVVMFSSLTARVVRSFRSGSAPVSLGALSSLGEGENSKAPAVTREAEEDWGR